MPTTDSGALIQSRFHFYQTIGEIQDIGNKSLLLRRMIAIFDQRKSQVDLLVADDVFGNLSDILHKTTDNYSRHRKKTDSFQNKSRVNVFAV
jgi:hypothetical protein